MSVMTLPIACSDGSLEVGKRYQIGWGQFKRAGWLRVWDGYVLFEPDRRCTGMCAEFLADMARVLRDAQAAMDKSKRTRGRSAFFTGTREEMSRLKKSA